MSRYYLGLDCSTQSLSAVLIDAESAALVYQRSLNYADVLTHYGVIDGYLPITAAGQVHAPPLMWVEALDALLLAMQEDACPLQEIRCIAGAAQQHGTVYLKQQFTQSLAKCDPRKPLHEQLQQSFSRLTAPIWMDNSTTEQCTAFTADLGGAEQVNKITGSVAVERFSGVQIKKFAESEPQAYTDTTDIMLVSAFMASLLAGHPVTIDYTDASGMNLLDLHSKKWHQPALDSCAPDLQKRLQPPVNPLLLLGTVAPYFTQRYGLNSNCKLLPWCGDNPSSLIGLGLVQPGMSAISLGTSDTCFGLFQELPQRMSPWAHTFIAPTLDYMSLLCFKNGSLARECVRQQFQLSWQAFSECLSATPPGNNGAMMLPWFDTEIVPKVIKQGVQRYALDADDCSANCRAVIEGQMLSMSLHAEQAGLTPTSIRATGGASQNQEILQIMADVFACPVDVIQTTNSVALGAALRAQFALEYRSWDETVAMFTAPQPVTQRQPEKTAVNVYREMKQLFSQRVADALNN